MKNILMTKLKRLLAMLVVGVMVVTTATPVMAAEQTAPVVAMPTAPIPDDGIVLNYYNKTFDVQQYTKYNPDLVTVFGSNTIMYPMHYVLCGIKEGRRLGDAWDSRAFVRNHSDYIWQATLAGSKDWFDAEKYRTMYPDIAAAFGKDDNACLVHYLYYGAYEGRFSCGKYDPAMFAYRYPLATVKTNCAVEEFQKAWQTQLSQGTNATGAGGTGAAPSSGDSGDSGSSGGGGSKKPAKPITVDTYTLRLTNGDDVKDVNLSSVNPYKVANPDDNKRFKDVYAECFGEAKVSMVAWCEGKVVATQTVTEKKFKVDEKAHTATLNLNKTYWKKTFKSDVAMPEYFQITWIPGESGTELPEPDDQLGDDWTVMKCRIGDQIIPLPITVQGLIDAGWTVEPITDVSTETVAANAVSEYRGTNPTYQTADEGLRVFIGNMSAADINYKDGIVYYLGSGTAGGSWYNMCIPGGVNMSNVDETLLTQKYGTPTGSYTNDKGSWVTWQVDNKFIRYCADHKSFGRALAYGVDPLWQPGGGDDTIDLGQDWTELKLTIDGELVQFPLAMSDLAKLGWEVDKNEAGMQIAAGESSVATVNKDSKFITIRAVNETDATLSIEQCKVGHILVTNEDYSPVVKFPGDLCNKDSTIEAFLEKFGEPSEDSTNDTARTVVYKSGSKEFAVTAYNSGTVSWFYGYTDEIDDTIQITSCDILKVDKDGGESSVGHEVTIENDGGLGWNDVYASYVGDGTLKAKINFNDGNSVSVDLDASNFTADNTAFQATLDLSKLNYSGAEVTVKDGVNTTWTFKYPNSGSGQPDVSGLGDDWKSMKFGFQDGTIIQLPISIQSLLDDGWEFVYSNQSTKVIDPWDSADSIDLQKDNNRFSAGVWNPDNVQRIIQSGTVYSAYFTANNNYVVLPGNIHMNAATEAQVIEIYGEPDNVGTWGNTWFDGTAADPGTGSQLRNNIYFETNSSKRVQWCKLSARVENNGMVTELKDTTLSSDASTGQFCIKSGEHIAIGDKVSDLTAKGYVVTEVTGASTVEDVPAAPDTNAIKTVTIAAPGSKKTIGGYVQGATDGTLADGTLVGINHTMVSGSSDLLLAGNILLSKATIREMQAAWGMPTDTNSESTAVEGGTDYTWELGTLVLQVYTTSEGKIHGIDFSVKN